jgi:hypothetical protein
MVRISIPAPVSIRDGITLKQENQTLFFFSGKRGIMVLKNPGWSNSGG